MTHTVDEPIPVSTDRFRSIMGTVCAQVAVLATITEDVAGSDSGRPESFFLNALWRELEEELWLPEAARACEPRFVGLLNDDTTPVGAVHAGLVYVLDLPLALAAATESVQVREISKMRGGFGPLVELARLWQTPSQFESWSGFLVQGGVAGPMGDSAERTV